MGKYQKRFMALSFHRLDNGEHLFDLDDHQFSCLTDIFETFQQWTGLIIDQYDDLQLTTENQETLIQVIDKYVDKTDLNKDKLKTAAILEFKGLLRFFSSNKVDLELLGD